MAHSYSQIHIHLVFSTKERRNSIPKDRQSRLWEKQKFDVAVDIESIKDQLAKERPDQTILGRFGVASSMSLG